jgi:16S rRNA (uracil1498-N3)-methyltransferase
MRRFYIGKNTVKTGKIIISGKEAHHIKDVIRLKPGDRFIGFDGEGKSYTLRIAETGAGIRAEIEKVSSRQINMPKILLACALPKKSKIDYIIEKATELGVADIIPMITEHTIIKIGKTSRADKQKRWERIALEASKQCGRDTLPKIYGITNFKDALKLAEKLNYKDRIMPYVCEEAVYIKDILLQNLNSIAIFIGPEGDFSEKEVSLAKRYNFKTASLGELVLKVDTAAIFAISSLKCIQTL